MAITGQIVVPRLAMWCAVYLDDERGEPVLQQVWHADERHGRGPAQRLVKTVPDELDDTDDAMLVGELTTLRLLARGRGIGHLVLGRPIGSPLRDDVLLVTDVDRAPGRAGHRQRPRAWRPARHRPGPPGEPAAAVAARRARARGGRRLRGCGRGDGGRRRLLRHLPRRWRAPGASWSATCAAPAPRPPRSPGSPGTPSARSPGPGSRSRATLERLNDAILDEGERARFLTLVCGIFRDAGRPGPHQPGQRRTPRAVRDRRGPAGAPDRHAAAAAGRDGEGGVRRRGARARARRAAGRAHRRRAGAPRRRADARRQRRRLRAEPRVGELPAQAVAERLRRLVVDFASTRRRATTSRSSRCGSASLSPQPAAAARRMPGRGVGPGHRPAAVDGAGGRRPEHRVAGRRTAARRRRRSHSGDRSPPCRRCRCPYFEECPDARFRTCFDDDVFRRPDRSALDDLRHAPGVPSHRGAGGLCSWRYSSTGRVAVVHRRDQADQHR